MDMAQSSAVRPDISVCFHSLFAFFTCTRWVCLPIRWYCKALCDKAPAQGRPSCRKSGLALFGDANGARVVKG